MNKTIEEKNSRNPHAQERPHDLISRLYREIGISAVAAALEAASHQPQKPSPVRKDIPAVLRNDEAA